MKNLLLFSTILLTSAGAFAQLTVKPNGAADSYVYVKDQILYVESDINLTRNGIANNQEASIYLRDNGQLIQGGTTSTNSGDGQLSVQQNTPETNAWAYYYWCSPVTHPAPAAGNRSFGVQHLYEPLPLTSVTAAQQSLTTTGREGTIIPRMTISTRWLYTFTSPGTEREGNYQRMNGNNAAPAGYGFIMKGIGPIAPLLDQTYDFRGRPNSGDFPIPVAAPILSEGQMTLAGNPYPSALDLNQLFYDTGNEELGEFWYYDEDRTVASHYYSQKPFGYGVWTPETHDDPSDPSYDGSLTDNNPPGIYTAAPFYFYNAGGGTNGGTGNSTNVDQNKRYAPIGQGIMFVGGPTPPGTPDGFVNIKNSHRIFVKEGVVSGSVFQRPGSDTDITATENEGDASRAASLTSTAIPDNRTPIMRIWSIFDEAVTRDMVIAFYDQATDGYDRGLDGLSAQDLLTDAYFPIGNDNDRKPYVINGIKFEMNKQVPIAFKIKNQTKLDVKAVEEIRKPYTQAYIFDNVENTYQQITGGQSATYTLPTGNYNNRFFVVFRNPNVKRDAPQTEVDAKLIVMENVTFFQNNPQHQLEVSNPEGYTLKSASVYDMSGKLVISETNLGDNNTYSFYTGNLSDGVYLVKLMTSDDIAIDYKAIVHN
ncbi:MAG: T9SS type A sorting domain-containing protein [Aequorivita sp.]|nr:T9SS type A sorting domain-containing protein [Aequorivita sp.]